MKSLILALGILVSLSAPVAAADTWVTIASDPPGASIYWTSPGPINQIEIPFGPAPQRIRVQLRHKDACVDTHALRVRWVSGVEAGLPSLHVCQKTPGKEPVTFIRPSGIPGLDTDARYALDLARLSQKARAAKAQQDTAMALAIVGGLNQRPAPPPPVLTPAEAQLRQQFPFSTLARETPGLTLADYEQVVRTVTGTLPTVKPVALVPALSVPPPVTRPAPPSLIGLDGTYLGTLSR